MRPKGHWVCALLAAVVLGIASGQAFSALRDDSEPELLARISRESNPVKKAKFEIRLARVKLLQAMDASEKGDYEYSLKLLDAYLERVTSAWSILQKSGRSPHKKPQGFKELDIELREDGRFLEDLTRSISVLDREPVEKIRHEVERIRAEVLKALFPVAESAGP